MKNVYWNTNINLYPREFTDSSVNPVWKFWLTTWLHFPWQCVDEQDPFVEFLAPTNLLISDFNEVLLSFIYSLVSTPAINADFV